jgi:cell wall-associated NlpC family hydrolase
MPEDFVPSAAYGRLVDGKLLASVEKHCLRLEEPEPACLILLRFPGSRVPTHMALMTENGNMIHANSDHGKVVEHGYRHPWTVMKHSLWRLPGVEQ